ncbi:MAG: TIGR02530 family flagellar biosynthesis protein [Bacillota bacterium]
MQVRVIDKNTAIRGPQAPAALRQPLRQGQAKGPNFAEVLGQEQKRVSFSKHAEERLQSSGQVMDESRMAQLENAMDVASSKGARSTLVLMKGMALVVAPQTRTVVTVIPEERMKENVFTAIDSAVVVDK